MLVRKQSGKLGRTEPFGLSLPYLYHHLFCFLKVQTINVVDWLINSITEDPRAGGRGYPRLYLHYA